MSILTSNIYTISCVNDGEDGVPSYIFTRYSSKENIHDDMYEVPRFDTLYMGTYVSNINTPSTSYSDYTWVKIKGDNALHVKVEAVNGTEFSNNGKIVSLKATGYNGSSAITGSYKWYRDGVVIPEATSNTYSVPCTGLYIYTIFKCVMTYNSIEVSDSITIKNNPSILYGDTNPYSGDSTIYTGSMWINTSTDPNSYYRYDGSNWVQITQQQYFDYVGYGQGKTTEFFTTKIKETADDITLIAERVTVNEVKINENYSEFKQTAESITSKVSNVESNFESTQSSIESMYSEIEQNADKISWMIKSGTSSTDFILTDRTATLIADLINLKGLIKFSGISSDAVSSINKLIQVGSRNCIRNSKTMLYEDYGPSFSDIVGVSYLTDENGAILIDEDNNQIIG